MNRRCYDLTALAYISVTLAMVGIIEIVFAVINYDSKLINSRNSIISLLCFTCYVLISCFSHDKIRIQLTTSPLIIFPCYVIITLELLFRGTIMSFRHARGALLLIGLSVILTFLQIDTVICIIVLLTGLLYGFLSYVLMRSAITKQLWRPSLFQMLNITKKYRFIIEAKQSAFQSYLQENTNGMVTKSIVIKQMIKSAKDVVSTMQPGNVYYAETHPAFIKRIKRENGLMVICGAPFLLLSFIEKFIINKNIIDSVNVINKTRGYPPITDCFNFKGLLFPVLIVKRR